MWVKLDDSFFEHRKVMILSVRAKLLFLAGLTHAAKNLTDGYLLDGDVRVIRAFAEASPTHVRELVDAKLWERSGHGYSIHDWSDYNPPAEKVRAERAAAKERMRRARGAARAAGGDVKGRGDGPERDRKRSLRLWAALRGAARPPDCMNKDQLATLTAGERYDFEHRTDPDWLLERFVTALADARLELDMWKQEFTRTLDDGRLYTQDALEAGKELADAEARARMATQDLETSRLEVARLTEELAVMREAVGDAEESIGMIDEQRRSLIHER